MNVSTQGMIKNENAVQIMKYMNISVIAELEKVFVISIYRKTKKIIPALIPG